MPYITETPTTPTLPREILKSNFITATEVNLAYQEFTRLLEKLKADRTITAADFWQQAEKLSHRTKPYEVCRSYRPKEYLQNLITTFPTTPAAYHLEDAQHELGHAITAKRFMRKHRITAVVYFAAIRENIGYLPIMGIENIETILNTRDLIIQYYEYMLAHINDPSPLDLLLRGDISDAELEELTQQAITDNQPQPPPLRTGGPRTTPQPTKPQLPRDRINS